MRIHVEKAIGRVKSFHILKHTIPIALAGLFNQIVTVYAFLSNFKPVFVSAAESQTEGEFDSNGDSDVEDYFAVLSESGHSDSDEE